MFIAIPLVATLVDKRFGARLDRSSTGYRVLRGAIVLAFSLNLMRLTGPMMWTLATNMGRMRSIAFLYVALMFIIFFATADRLYQSDRLSINSYDFFGASRTHAVEAAFYEDARTPGQAYMHAPSIQSDIIRDPYVKLFIPYNPRRHNAAIAKGCPGLKPLQERGIQVGADPYLADSVVVPVLACFARLHAVTLDEVSQGDLPLAFHTHARSGLKGVLAYLPAATLAPGRHVLTVMPMPPEELPTDSAALARAAWKQPYVIPFWR